MDANSNYRILLVEDYVPLRRTYERTFGDASYDIVAVETIEAAREVLKDGELDLHAALLDYRLPDGTANCLVQELLDRKPLCRSAVVTGAADDETALEAVRCGAHMYIRKPETFPNLLQALATTIRSTLEWRRVLGQPVPGELTAAAQAAPGPVGLDMQNAIARLGHLASLSHIETLVAWRLLWGDSNKRIAQLVGCTERTAKYHVAAVLARTGAQTRNGLLRVLLEDAGVEDPWLHRAERDEALEE